MTKLKTMRRVKKIKQSHIAHSLGISKQAVYQQERLGIFSIRTAQRYAAALGCSPLDLLDMPEEGACHE